MLEGKAFEKPTIPSVFLILHVVLFFTEKEDILEYDKI